MISRKRTAATALVLALLLTLSAFPCTALAEDGETFELTLLYGGVNAEAYVSRLAKDVGGNALIFNTGGSLGEDAVALMNAVGYAALVPGNRDFLLGIDALHELSAQAAFPFLAANVGIADGETPFQPYEIFKISGVTVGVFGLAAPDALTTIDARIAGKLTVGDPAQTAETMVSKLREEGCDIIIALAHSGFTQEKPPTFPGIDAVICGTSKTPENSGSIGVITISTSDGATQVSEKTVAADDILPDEEIVALSESLTESYKKRLVGYAPVLLQGEKEYVQREETNLTKLIADSMRWATGANVALLTGGRIGASIPQGEITMERVLAALPNDGNLMKIELTGAELLLVLEQGVSGYPAFAESQIHVSGLRLTYDPREEAFGRITRIEIGKDGAFDAEKTYTVAVAEGDGFDDLGANRIYTIGGADALVKYLKLNPPLTSQSERRIEIPEEAEMPPQYSIDDETPFAAPEENSIGRSASEEPTKVYVVQPGECLTQIARAHGTTWMELQQLNNLENPHLIFPGQVFVLP